MSASSVRDTSSAVPPDYFVIKLYQMLREQPEVITWDPEGGIVIHDRQRLESTLSVYFRHNRFTSFQRQLNNFGFHKKRRATFAGGVSTRAVGRKGAAYDHPLLCGEAPEAVLRLRRDSRPSPGPVPKVATSLVSKAAMTCVEDELDEEESGCARSAAPRTASVLETLANVAASALHESNECGEERTGTRARGESLDSCDSAASVRSSSSDPWPKGAARGSSSSRSGSASPPVRKYSREENEEQQQAASAVASLCGSVDQREASSELGRASQLVEGRRASQRTSRVAAAAQQEDALLSEEAFSTTTTSSVASSERPRAAATPPVRGISPVRPRRARPFPCVLREMIEDSPDEVVRWSADGTVFLVGDAVALCAAVLPRYFRHCRLASFQRQLSLYQFRRARSATNDRGGGPGTGKPPPSTGLPLAYHHPLFHREANERQLRAITRAQPGPRQHSPPQHTPFRSPHGAAPHAFARPPPATSAAPQRDAQLAEQLSATKLTGPRLRPCSPHACEMEIDVAVGDQEMEIDSRRAAAAMVLKKLRTS